MTPTPRGKVTFLFSDVEGSTRLLEAHPDQIGPALAQHHELLAGAIEAHSGVVFETVGDAVYAAFQNPPDAARAALTVHRALAAHEWGVLPRLHVRIALHTGEVESRGTHYFGAPLFRCARLQALAVGGQTLLSETLADLVRDELPADGLLRDLGWQRLKDLDEPEHVFQLDGDGLPSEFPPLRSIGEAKHNLPAEFSSFVGRGPDLERLGAQVAEPGVIVVEGPGGVGKTRLAIHLAHDVLDQFPQGCYFVEFAPLSHVSECVPAVAVALHLRETPGRSIEEVVTAYLADKKMLVILDNAEHLADVNAPIRQLATSAPQTTFLVTSRSTLNLPGARHELLRPMSAVPPATDEGMTSPAVSLLVDRVRALDPSFQLNPEIAGLLTEICSHVDGLPLGLELVAPAVARIGVRSTLDSLARHPSVSMESRGPDDRQSSLAATVAWSYQLLGLGARKVLAQLAVFAGSFEISAARAVCGALPEETDRELLTLVAGNLVLPVEGAGDERRFSMLVTVQEFARQMLTSSALADAEAKHAAYYARLAAAASEQLQGPNQGTWRSQITLELPNLRAALAWTERNAVDGLLEMVVDLEQFWGDAGLNAEGWAWLERAMDTPTGDLRLRARGLRWRGVLAEHHGDIALAGRTYRELSALQRQMGDDAGLADTWRGMAGVAATQGRPGEARRLLHDALAAHRRYGDTRRVADALHNLALLELESGDAGAALALSTEMEPLYRELGDTTGLAVARHHRGRALRQMERYEEAELASSEALSMLENAGNEGWLSPPLINLAWVALALGDGPRARARICRALAQTQIIDEPFLMPRILEARAALAAVDGYPDFAHRIVQAATALRRRGGFSRCRSDYQSLARYVKPLPKLEPSEEPTDLQVDALIREVLDDCPPRNPETFARTATRSATATRKPMRVDR